MINSMKLFGIYSKRGLWTELVKGPRGSIKRVTLFARAEAQKKAEELNAEHKQAYWIEEVEVISDGRE